MTYDPFKHHRQSMRLKGFDYTQAGAYFVTICVKNGQCVFGVVVDCEMRLNNWGRIVDTEWRVIPELRDYVALDVHGVMPNHFHGLFWILDDALPANVGFGAPNPYPMWWRKPDSENHKRGHWVQLLVLSNLASLKPSTIWKVPAVRPFGSADIMIK